MPVAAVVEPQKTKSLVEEHPDPTYDVIGGTGGGHEFIETPNGLEDVRLSAHGSRRASMSSDMRSRCVGQRAEIISSYRNSINLKYATDKCKIV